MDATDLVDVQGLVVRRGSFRLEIPSWRVAPGQVIGIVGPNGAGKTTLLRALAGVVRPAGGSVRRPASCRIGYMSAASGVYRDLTTDENLAFAAGAYGLRGARFVARRDELLERTQLTEARHRLAGHLSGGMRQKLAFALAVVHEPDLLVLDEPTTGVDPVSRAELWRLMAAAAVGGAAVVLATTYLDEAERATAVLVLDRGRTLLSGDPAAIVQAMPGALYAASTGACAEAPLAGERRWRRGRDWRVWSPSGTAPAGAAPVTPDLADVAIVASMTARDHDEPDERSAAAAPQGPAAAAQ
jgi:ABC-2 type transport system ATP-binding protein